MPPITSVKISSRLHLLLLTIASSADVTSCTNWYSLRQYQLTFNNVISSTTFRSQIRKEVIYNWRLLTMSLVVVMASKPTYSTINYFINWLLSFPTWIIEWLRNVFTVVMFRTKKKLKKMKGKQLFLSIIFPCREEHLQFILRCHKM